MRQPFNGLVEGLIYQVLGDRAAMGVENGDQFVPDFLVFLGGFFTVGIKPAEKSVEVFFSEAPVTFHLSLRAVGNRPNRAKQRRLRQKFAILLCEKRGRRKRIRANLLRTGL